MPRGVIMSISGREAVILTKDSNFVKVLLPEGRYDIGQEVDAADAKTNLVNKWLFSGAGRLAAAAAVLLIAVILPVAVTTFFINTNVYAYVTLDINPSTEFSVNVRERIIKAIPLNEEGAVLLEGANLKGREIEYGIEYVVGKACELGYTAPGEEGAVIATTVMEKESDAQFEEKVSSTLEKTIEHNSLTVETGVLSATKEIKEEAEKAGVSAGKYIIALQASEDNLVVDMEEVKNSSISSAINKAGGNLGSILKKARKTDEELRGLFEKNREKLRDKNSRDNDGGREDNDSRRERDNNGRNISGEKGRDGGNNDNARETVRNNNSDNGSNRRNNNGAEEGTGERDGWPYRGSRDNDRDDDKRDNNGRDNNRNSDKRDNNSRDNDRDDDKRDNNGRDNNRNSDKRDNNSRDKDRDDDNRNKNARDNNRDDDKRDKKGWDNNRDDNNGFNENYRDNKWRPGLFDDILIHLFR